MIEGYRFGQIVVDGVRYTSDVVILPHRIIADWHRKRGHSLAPQDVAEIVQEKPELLVVGTGRFGQVEVPTEVQQHLEAHHIKFMVQDTPQACQAYNRLCHSQRVAAALHLTC